jgi:hypothetical protein
LNIAVGENGPLYIHPGALPLESERQQACLAKGHIQSIRKTSVQALVTFASSDQWPGMGSLLPSVPLLPSTFFALLTPVVELALRDSYRTEIPALCSAVWKLRILEKFS